MGNIRIYKEDEKQYRTLKLFAEMVTDFSKTATMKVENIYFDMGQNWWYSALVTYKDNDSWQSFCPRDYELILYTDSITILEKMARYYSEKVDESKISIHLYEEF